MNERHVLRLLIKIGIRPLASKLFDSAGCKLLLKLGDKGLIACRGSNHAVRQFLLLIVSLITLLMLLAPVTRC